MKGKKITIFGLGVSGTSAFRLLEELQVTPWVVNNGTPSDWPLPESFRQRLSQDDPNAEVLLSQSDWVILSPGIPRSHPLLKNCTGEIINETELALRVLPELTILAVTGTNGKTTTVSLLAHLLKASGKSVFLGGNIGTPLSDLAAHYLKDHFLPDFVVLELSSFQLESLPSLKAKVAIILNITEAHGERYESVKDYAAAKLNIFSNQDSTDLGIIGDTVRTYSPPERVEVFNSTGQKKLLDKVNLNRFRLVGIHNRENLAFCLKALEYLKIEVVQDGIDSFKGVKYRLQRIGPLLFNDAKSTNPLATLTALNAVREVGQSIFLIMGGQCRGRNDRPKELLGQLGGVERVFSYGDSAEIIQETLSGQVEVACYKNLVEVIEGIKKIYSGQVILFSPGYPSFDQFKNYEDRGAFFEKITKEFQN